MRNRSRAPLLRLFCVILAVAAAGCGSRPKTVRAWGEVRWQGTPVEEGVIVLFPIDGTAGPSTGGSIAAGRYDVPRAKGPRAGGIYRVEITANGKERLYNPNASPTASDTPIPVRDQILPPRFNTASTLRAEIAPNADSHRQDFLLQ